MSSTVDCEQCRQPIRSTASKARRVGGRCWRKLTPAQRQEIRELLALTAAPSAAGVRAALNRIAPAGVGQLPLENEESST